MERNLTKMIKYLLISIVFLSSCVQKDEKANIEIFLLNERPVTQEGISYKELLINEVVNEKFASEIDTSLVRYDTLKSEFIYAGSFDAVKKVFLKKPFIESSEIIGFNSDKNTFFFSKSAAEKINSLKPSMRFGVPFVICENGKPFFTGYFWSTYSSYGSTWYCIKFDHMQKKYSNNNTFSLFKGSGLRSPRDVDMKNDSERQKIINIFQKSDKIVNNDGIVLNQNILF
jgi:hypothetical protein